jgi:protein disulfide-isomerase A6
MALRILLAAALVSSANAGAIALNPDNFDAEVFDSGKSAFIKFLAPW